MSRIREVLTDPDARPASGAVALILFCALATVFVVLIYAVGEL